jgi:DNA-binding transcriptional MerR regulator
MLASGEAVSRTKSPEAFRTISEVADALNVPQHVLRFWETRFHEVKPVKRAGGRRYYRPEDIELLRGIRALLYSDGFTIRGVQKILKDRGFRHVAGIGRESVQDGDDAVGDDAVPCVVVARDLAPSNVEPPNAVPGDASAVGDLSAFDGPAPPLDEESRTRLEITLAELLTLKHRLRATRA